MATAATVNELGSYTHNPRGNLWFNDESSYGQKLLFKMGWRKGKGLGKKEDGIKENLKVKFRNSNSGLGYKDDLYNNVMKTEYESILKSLRDEYPQQETIKGCNKNADGNKEFKQRSKIVKSKIRYPKLYYAKDVSRYSEEDMKSIFICSLPAKHSEEEISKDSDSGGKRGPENQLPKVQETYTSHLSISDYFNQKMKEKKDNEQMKRCSNYVRQEETDYNYNTSDSKIKQEKLVFENNKSDCEIKQKESDFESHKAHFEINEESANFQCPMSDKSEMRPSRKKCKKSKKNTEVNINGNDKEMFLAEKEREGVIITNRKRKKMSEPSLYEGFTGEKIMESSNCMNYQLSACKKRKKSHKKENHITSADTEALSACLSAPRSDIVIRKKKKKSHRHKDGISVDEVELLSVISLEDGVSTNSELASNLSAAGLMEVTEESLSNVNNSSTKKKKKLKNKINSLKTLKSCLKSKSNEYAVKNVSFNESISYKIIDSDNESTVSLSDSQEKVQNDLKISASASNHEEDSSNSKHLLDSNHEHEGSSESKRVLNSNDEHEMDSSGSKQEIQDNVLSKENRTSQSDALETTSDEETETNVSLTSLPSSNSSYYNSWVESQKLAMKMKVYKNVLNSIKKHNVLKTTNLLSIKGYGNWGF